MRRLVLLGFAAAAAAAAGVRLDAMPFDELHMSGPDGSSSLAQAKQEHDAEVADGSLIGLNDLPPQTDEAATALGAPLAVVHTDATLINVPPGTGEAETGLLGSTPKPNVHVLLQRMTHDRPTLVLEGGRTHHFEVSSKSWQDPGAKCYAFDKNDGIKHIRSYADRSGAVDLRKPGRYRVHYSCTDVHGVQSEPLTRNIIVHARSNTLDNKPAFKVDCVMEMYQPWTACTQSCGDQGVQQHTRTIAVYPSPNGAPCGVATETRACNVFGCPVDCQMGSWGGWDRCSRTCGKGTRHRAQPVVTAAAFGGRPCPPEMWTTEYHVCSGLPCASDCEVSAWTAWTHCSKSCGGAGTETRYRVITSMVSSGGKVCPTLLATRACEAQGCPVDCVVSPWGAWSTCTVTCGVGRQQRVRTQLVAGANGGKACPTGTQQYKQTKLCHETSCDDCAVSQWTPMYGCSKSCGGGVQVYRRVIVKGAVLAGATCPGLLRQEPCNPEPCAVDCAVSAFGPWSTCTAECGGGAKVRARTVSLTAAFGGRACPHLHMTEKCNSHACPNPCKVAPWSKWSTKCSRSCGSGVVFRKRAVIAPPELGGAPCPNLVDYLHCNTKPCPEDCEVGKWGEFGACTKSCGGGHTTRMRKLLRAPTNYGDACPSLLEVRDCNRHACGHAKCHDSHAHCYVQHSNNKVVVTHSKKAFDLGGNFKCRASTKARHELSRMFAGCECHCDTHEGCCYRENVALHNPPIPGNVLDEKHVTSVDACCHRCTMHPGCGSWEFTTRGTHGNPLLPRLKLVEGKELSYEENRNQHYLDAGATCFDGEVDISRKVTTTGDTVMIGKVGTYTITYHCTGFGGAAALPVTRTVTVTPRDGPQLILSGGVSQVFFKQRHIPGVVYHFYKDPGATCLSSKGGPLEVDMPNVFVHRDVVGTTILNYACTDPDTGTKVSETRTVTVVPKGFGIPDQLRPVLSLLGAAIVSLDESQTATYADAGAKCHAHSTDRPLTPTMSGDVVNLAKAGMYTVVYDCSDEEGVPAKTVKRAVHVLPKLRPTLTTSGGYLESFSRSDTQKYAQPAVQCFDRDGADITSLVKRTGDKVRLDVVGDYVQRFDCQDALGTAALTLVHRVVVKPVHTVRQVGKALCVLKRGEPVFVKLGAPELKGDSIAFAGPRAPNSVAETQRQEKEFCPVGGGKVTNKVTSSAEVLV